MRPSSDIARGELKSWFRHALRQAGGGDSFCHATRVSATQLSRYGSIDAAEFPPIDVLLDLEIDIGAPVVTSRLAQLMGWRLVPLDSADSGSAASPAHLPSTAADVVGQTAHLFTAIEQSLRDGRIDAAEANALGKQMAIAAAAFLRVQERLAAVILPSRSGLRPSSPLVDRESNP